MKKKEIKSSIKIVYGELWNVLALYEPTECYNKTPEGEKDVWDYMGDKLLNVRRIINMLFLGEKELTDKLLQIVDETEYFVRSYEMPGVVKRWKRINEKLLFFDAAFTVMENTPEVYKTISKGQTDITFACYPDEELIKERKRYFEQVREKNETNNFRYSEERIFLNELLHTLKMVFEADFAEYL